ncbi:universal stress protein [Pollutimonas harenae]|uniref:Universal stress protein n=1 Tax=Pollutimonas harenae TaxID=657015 RepID=A0A853H0Z4_9BURK|nr:universal stress protein [Pollutimonas harenae]NYT85992.1 universal stress protein [Pollutimonas harenae]TEA71041.1 universal stress protein [Pollutimonas harenae]
MRTILVPVDGSESSLRAVRAAIKAANELGGANLHVITVQAPILSGNVTRFFSAEAIQDYYQDEGSNALVSAKALLDESGVAYQSKVVVGPVAMTIADYAKDNSCDLIIMGTRGLGSVTGLVLGSITTKVLSLTELPVTLVK